MKTALGSKNAIIALLVGFSCSIANAQLGPASIARGGSGAGPGGDPRCAEFYTMASEMSIQLSKLGQASVDQINPLINVALLREVVKNLKVLPEEKLDRTARSGPEAPGSASYVTLLKVKDWKKLSPQEKERLVAHELMVLTQAEGEGEYRISHDLLVALDQTLYGLPKKCRNAARNVDGTYTIYLPIAYGYFLLISSDSPAEGVCKYLGFSRWAGAMQTAPHVHNAKMKINEHGAITAEEDITKSAYTYINCQ